MQRSIRRPIPSLKSAVGLVLGLALMLAGPFAPSSEAWAKKKAEAPAPEAKKDDDSPFKEWDKALKDVETKKGLFIVHRKYDNAWLEIAPDQLEKPYLMVSSLSSGLGKGFILGGLPLDTDLWVLHRVGGKIQIRVRNARFRAPAGTPMSDAVGLSYADSILASAKIISIQADTKHLLIDLNEIFMSDLPGIGLQLKGFLGAPAGFDKEKSSLAQVKVFPANMEIEIAASFSASDPKPLDTVSDIRYLPVGLHYSLSELPGTDLHGRLADDRVGYFMTAVKDFSRDAEDTFFVRYVNRWDLQKQDPSAALSPPKQSIVFYLDKTIPREYRDVVRDGTLLWNKAFEAAGFKDAVVVKDAPDDPDFDPEDARYNTIRWITSSEPSFGAIGPSRVDPRNGHILDADILVEAAMVQNARRGYRNYIGTRRTAAGSGSAADLNAYEQWLEQNGSVLCSMAEGTALQTSVDGAAFAVMGETTPGGDVPESYVLQFFHWVVSHEVGHTLGLRHNFRASAATPNDRLNDVAWTRQHGLYDSVMEYPAPNFSLDRAAQGDYYSQVVGDYDVWAIRYGYTPVADAQTSEQELPALLKIAAESTQPGHEYGTDEDAFAGPVPLGADPSINQFDLGADPLAYTKDRLALIQDVRSKLGDKLIGRGESWDRLRNAFDSLVNAQAINLSIVSKQIGGLSTSRSHKDDPGAHPPLVPVPAGRQRLAMEMIVDSGFSDSAWTVAPGLIDHLQPSRWAHWGSDAYADGQVNYPWTEKIVAIQSGLLDRLLHPLTLGRIVEVEARSPRGESYTLAEHLASLNDAVFSELTAKAAPGGFALSVTRRNLGRALLERELEIVNRTPAGLPADARSLTRMNLAAVEKKMSAVLTTRSAGMDEATRAYLEESRTRIRRALDAQSVLIAG